MRQQGVLQLAAVGVVACVFAVGLDGLGRLSGLEQLELGLLDARQRMTIETFQPVPGRTRESEIVLILFDEYSVTDSTDGWPYEAPVPRAHLAELVDALAAAGARTIGLDVYLERLYPELNRLDGGDDRLREAIARAGNVILSAPLGFTSSSSVIQPPHPDFESVASDVGFSNLFTSFDRIHDAALAAGSEQGWEPSFVLALYAHARGLDPDSLLAEAAATGRIQLPGLPSDIGTIRPARAGAVSTVPFTIRWVGPPSSTDPNASPGTFPAYSSALVATTSVIAPDIFRDKIVLVGTGFRVESLVRTPFTGYFGRPVGEGLGATQPYGFTFEVEVSANALQNLLDGEYATTASRPLSIATTAIAGLATSLAFAASAGAGFLVSGLALAGIVALSFWLWVGEIFAPLISIPLSERFVWFPAAMPAVAVAFGAVGGVSVRRLEARKAEPDLLDRERSGAPPQTTLRPGAFELPADELALPMRVLEVLGEGGMGRVYRAEQPDPVRREVALKVLHPHLVDGQVKDRFSREQAILANLQHPSIAAVFAGGLTEDGVPYLVMELVDGPSITAFADERRLGVDERIRLLLPVLDAVAHAHRMGIIHRDLKPSNILVSTASGTPVPKVIDFGIAHLVGASDATRLTSTDLAIGTPGYMSPEQLLEGLGEVGAPMDVYGLGIVLFELLVGELPFERRVYHGPAIFGLVQRRPPRASRRLLTLDDTQETVAERRGTNPRELRRALGGRLDWIVARALEPRQEDRYPTVQALADDLRKHLRGEQPAARSVSLSRILSGEGARITVAFGALAWLASALFGGLATVLGLPTPPALAAVALLTATYPFWLAWAVRSGRFRSSWRIGRRVKGSGR